MHENLPQLAAYCAPASAYCGPRRTLAGSLLTVLLPALVIGALSAGFYLVLIPWLEGRQMGSGYVLLFRATSLVTEAMQGQSPRGVLMVLTVVLVTLPSLWLVLNKLHHRPLRSVFGPSLRLNWRDVAIGAVVVLGAALLRPSLYTDGLPSLTIPPATWLIWLPIALPILFAQCLTEEMFFRGYLQQQLAARFASRWAWLVLPSVLFSLIHYNSGAPALLNWMNIAALAIMGAMAADVTARTGNLGAAVGLHFGNNLYLVLLHTQYNTMNGLALMQSPPPSTLGGLILAPIEHVLPLLFAYMIYRNLTAPRAHA
jgi:membrane protease YdiL (CAAX protease family)